ncbi:hypothetical protein VL04_12580 [Chromobacterium violaceum]|nr:hypothetical protein UF16_19625 [Chromobacterium violaceum]KMN48138.1 hypothetical protein VK93_18000 [Chromobacterium violaceum]KMN86530.1 hypothetical protein VL02_09005 [Chromobacterium violaceum]KMN90012.1 hypothetical protein VL04_12580 [Chromobacterium violaceum]KMO02073.1 hypothetical protein VL16_20295 [Chromobacterium violaceum]
MIGHDIAQLDQHLVIGQKVNIEVLGIFFLILWNRYCTGFPGSLDEYLVAIAHHQIAIRIALIMSTL